MINLVKHSIIFEKQSVFGSSGQVSACDVIIPSEQDRDNMVDAESTLAGNGHCLSVFWSILSMSS